VVAVSRLHWREVMCGTTGLPVCRRPGRYLAHVVHGLRHASV